MEIKIYLYGYTKRCNEGQIRGQNLIGYDKSLIERRSYMVLIEHYNFLPLLPLSWSTDFGDPDVWAVIRECLREMEVNW